MKSSRVQAGRLLTALALSAPWLLLSAEVSAAPSGRTVKLLVSHQPAMAASLRAQLVAVGGRVTDDLTGLDALAVEVPASQVARLKSLRGVTDVEEDAVRTLLGRRAHGSSRELQAASGSQIVPYGIPLVQADQVVGTGSWRPKVCIIDSGIDGTHEDLAKNAMAGKNFTTSGKWNTDENSHGTHVAGTVAARFNALGVVGVNANKQVSLYIAKVFDAAGTAPSSRVAKAMLACKTAGANVVSMSLGGATATKVEHRAVKALQSAGALVIAAAGNGGDSSVSYPAGFKEVVSVAAVDANKAWATFSQFNADVEISGPGVLVLSSVPMGTGLGASLAVNATGYEAIPLTGAPVSTASSALYDFGLGTVDDPGVAGKVCLISRGTISFAEKVTRCETNGGLGAVIFNNLPGNFSGTLNGAVTHIPSMSVSQADGATLKGQIGSAADLAIAASNYAHFNGTSMATPHVSGVAALVWSFHPECTAAQMRDALNLSALDIGDPGKDTKTGNGLVQAQSALDYIASHPCGS